MALKKCTTNTIPKLSTKQLIMKPLKNLIIKQNMKKDAECVLKQKRNLIHSNLIYVNVQIQCQFTLCVLLNGSKRNVICPSETLFMSTITHNYFVIYAKANFLLKQNTKISESLYWLQIKPSKKCMTIFFLNIITQSPIIYKE